MASNPQLSQSTAVAKVTDLANRLNAIVPSIATENSPVKVYTPGVTSASDLSGTLFGATGTWVCPPGVSSVMVEEWGGGGGGGSTSQLTGAPLVVGTGTSSSATSITVPVTTSTPVTPDDGTHPGYMYVGVSTNGSAVLVNSVTDTQGNSYGVGTILNTNNAASAGYTSAPTFGFRKLMNGIDSVTVNFSGSVSASVVVLWVQHGSSLFANNGQSGSSATVAFAPNESSSYSSLAIATISVTGSQTITVPSGWHLIYSGSNGTYRNYTIFRLTSVQSAKQPDSTTVTLSSTNTWAVIYAVYTLNISVGQLNGGGGGGGGEYACEDSYPVIPLEAYTYVAGVPGVGGKQGLDGGQGGDTVFDLTGKGITGGVVAHGGQGGLANGTGGNGGTGSSNTTNFDGGAGGTTAGAAGGDNPTQYTGVGPNLALWWKLDGTETHPQDYSGKGFNGTIYQSPSGLVVNSGTGRYGFSSPSQVPPSTLAQNPSYVPGSFYELEAGNSSSYAGYIRATSDIQKGASWANMTVSAWVNGNIPNSWGSQQNAAYIVGTLSYADRTNTNAEGWMLWINASGKLVFSAKKKGTTSPWELQASWPGVSGDNLWHQVVVSASFFPSSSVQIYADGVQRATTTTFLGQAINSPTMYFVVGGDPKQSNLGIDAAISNVWLSQSTTTLAQVQSFYGINQARGGSGGGASGGMAGTGNAGSGTATDTGGAGGTGVATTDTIHVGSEGGAAGGNVNVSGTSANGTNNPGGGGGGGAGAYDPATLTSGQQIFAISGHTDVPAMGSASYTGLDASSSNSGALFTQSINPIADDALSQSNNSTAANSPLCYSGGQASNPERGTMVSVVQFPDLTQVLADNGVNRLKDVTRATVTLTMTVHSTNASILPFWWVTPDALPSVILPGDGTKAWINPFTSIGGAGVLAVPAGDAGRRLTFEFPNHAGFFTAATTPGGVAMLFGVSMPAGVTTPTYTTGLTNTTPFTAVQHYNDPAATDWYTEFYGAGTDNAADDIVIGIDYLYSASNVNGGAGDGGRILIKYVTAEGTPVTTILPAAATDASGNVLAKGITTASINTWHPGSSPLTVEGWTQPTLNANWSNIAGLELKYKLYPDNTIGVSGQITYSSTSTTAVAVFQLPVGYRPIRTQLFLVVDQNATTGTGVARFGTVATDGTLSIYLGGGTPYVAGRALDIVVRLPLD